MRIAASWADCARRSSVGTISRWHSAPQCDRTLIELRSKRLWSWAPARGCVQKRDMASRISLLRCGPLRGQQLSRRSRPRAFARARTAAAATQLDARTLPRAMGLWPAKRAPPAPRACLRPRLQPQANSGQLYLNGSSQRVFWQTVSAATGHCQWPQAKNPPLREGDGFGAVQKP